MYTICLISNEKTEHLFRFVFWFLVAVVFLFILTRSYRWIQFLTISVTHEQEDEMNLCMKLICVWNEFVYENDMLTSLLFVLYFVWYFILDMFYIFFFFGLFDIIFLRQVESFFYCNYFVFIMALIVNGISKKMEYESYNIWQH